MKIIGIFLIAVCVVLNISLGVFLYTKGNNIRAVIVGILKSETQPNTESKKDILVDHVYDNYGFSFKFPSQFKSGNSDIKNGLIDYLYNEGEKDSFEAEVLVRYEANQKEGDITDSEEYKQVSKTYFENLSKDLKIKHLDGGIIYTTSGIKLYYDFVSKIALEYNQVRIIEKSYTFYHKNGVYSLILQDDEVNFEKNIQEFDKMIETVKLF